MAASQLDRAMCGFWVQARNIFKALAVTFTCRCDEHSAKLLLQHRTRTTLEFDLIVTALSSSRWELHKTRISHGGKAVASLSGGSRTLPGSQPSIPIRQQSPWPRESRLARPLFQRGSQSTITTVQHVRFVPAPQPRSLALEQQGKKLVQREANMN